MPQTQNKFLPILLAFKIGCFHITKSYSNGFEIKNSHSLNLLLLFLFRSQLNKFKIQPPLTTSTTMGNSKTNNKNKLEDSEKKSVSSPWSRPTSQQHQQQQRLTTFLGLKNTAVWIFLIVFIFYVLYSTNILTVDRREECSTTLDSSTEEHIQTLTNISSTNINNSSKFLRVDDDEEEEKRILEPVPLPLRLPRYDTQLKHIVFGIAGSSNLWVKRKEYIKLWWRPKETRGVVWLDKKVYAKRNEGLPEIRISGDTSRFKYTNRQGQRSALRISRVVSETLRLGMKDVRWFVMGDDDTVFMVENVVRVLSKYDHRQFYYIGSSSESHVQNIYFSYAMAYGGGGFAISYPLAKELEKMQDRCIQRYFSFFCLNNFGIEIEDLIVSTFELVIHVLCI